MDMILGVLVEMDQGQSQVSDQDMASKIETYLKKEVPAAKVLFRRTPIIYEEQALRLLQKVVVYEHHYPMVNIVNLFSELMSFACPEMDHQARALEIETQLKATITKVGLQMTPNRQDKGLGLSGEDWCKVITELHP